MTDCDAAVYTWDELATDRPMPLISRKRIVGQQAMISRVTLEAGFVLPSHHHESEQFACILEGRARFGIGAEGSPSWKEVIVGSGQVLHLPSNVPHSCEAIETTIVLDIFSPTAETTGIDRDGS